MVLLQQGKGADIAGAFGGGGSQTAFGARGATTFLHKLTTGAFVAFVLLSVLLSILEARPRASVIKTLPAGRPRRRRPRSGAAGPAGARTGAPGTSTAPAAPPASAPAAPAASAPAQPAPVRPVPADSSKNPSRP